MITSNTSIPFIKAENSENKFYLSRLTSEYNEGDSITTSTAINCRKLAIAIKAGDKITINGTSLTVYADAAVDATSFFVEAITLDEALNINANIAIDEDNMFVQYQRKTEGTVAGFDIDADGMSKGGVEITGWLDSDTMEGATENNIPTAQSVKAYVDGQVGASDTLAEVLANGNTTSGNDMIFTDSDELKIGTASDLRLYHNGSDSYIRNYTGTLHIDNEASGQSLIFKTVATERLRINSSGKVGIGTTSPSRKLDVEGRIRFSSNVNQAVNGYGEIYTSYAYGKGQIFIAPESVTNPASFHPNGGIQIGATSATPPSGGLLVTGNVGIGTTSPASLLHVAGTVQVGVDEAGHDVIFYGDTAGYNMMWDTSSNRLEFTDNVKATFGNGVDLQIYHTGSHSNIKADGTGDLIITQATDDQDIILKCDDGSGGTTAYLTLDGSAGHTKAHKEIQFEDSVHARFGNGSDLRIFHDGSNSEMNNHTGHLSFINYADDKDIIFKSDDGSGGTTEYFRLDGSVGGGSTVHTVFPDNSKACFGSNSGGDTLIWHDGTNSYIKQQGGGDLIIQQSAADKDIILQSDDGSGGETAYLTLDGSQETVNVYKNLLIGTTTDSGYKLDVNGTQRVQDVLELDDVLTLNAISTPDDPADGKSSIYMDSADGNIKVKINVGGEVVTRTIASYDG